MTNEPAPTLLSIFSGIGGLDLAFESVGFRTLAFVEYEPIKQIILRAHFPTIPIYGNIREFDCREFLRTHGRPNVIAGGPPCQSASLLGKRLGTADDRWLWDESVRLVGELRPNYAVFENPPALLSVESGRAFNGILSRMAEIGYDGWWDVIPAAAFGAGHWRERLCIVFADANRSQDWERHHSFRGDGSTREGEQIGAGGGAAFSSNSNDIDGRRGGQPGRQDGRKADNQRPEFLSADSDSERRNGQPILLRPTSAGGAGEKENSETPWQGAGSLPSNPDDARLQGHTGHGDGSSGRSGKRRPDAAPRLPDLRGRVTGPDWWFRVVAGVPCVPAKMPDGPPISLLVNGIPSKLVEAFSLCAGDAVCPQAWQPIAQTLYDAIQARRSAAPILK